MAQWFMAATVRHSGLESRFAGFLFSPFSSSGLDSNETSIIITHLLL